MNEALKHQILQMILGFVLVTSYLLKIFSDVFIEPLDSVLQQELDNYQWAPLAVKALYISPVTLCRLC